MEMTIADLNSTLLNTWGLSGKVFSPAPLMHPQKAVIVVGGSEGGLHERDAQALAQAGFTVLALAYFGASGVPTSLHKIPLEYFSRAVDLLISLGAVPGAIGILGGSRGGEAALAVAARDPRIGAVVSVVGSGVITQGIDYAAGSLDRILAKCVPAWTFGGTSLPYLPNRVTPDLIRQVNQGGVIRLAQTYAPLPSDQVALDAISTPVERIRGAVLLISAEDDGMWDSRALSQVAADRLECARHAYPWQHDVMKGAGHMLAGVPGAPITSSTGPGPGVMFDYGGDPAITTEARQATWELSVTFLQKNLGNRENSR